MQNKDRKDGGGEQVWPVGTKSQFFPYDTVIRPTYLLPRTLTTSLAPLRTTLTEARTTGSIELLKSPRDEANPKTQKTQEP